MSFPLSHFERSTLILPWYSLSEILVHRVLEIIRDTDVFLLNLDFNEALLLVLIEQDFRAVFRDT